MQYLVLAVVSVLVFEVECKDKKPDYRHPAVKTKEANKRFHKCCKDNLPEECWDACYYDVPLLPTAKRVFVDGDKKKGIQPCSVLEHFIDYLRCANGGPDAEQDNKKCCTALGVTKNDHDVCSPFCNPSEDFRLTKPMKSCGPKLSKILTCHQYGLGEEDSDDSRK